jgi:hypothetical protein
VSNWDGNMLLVTTWQTTVQLQSQHSIFLKKTTNIYHILQELLEAIPFFLQRCPKACKHVSNMVFWSSSLESSNILFHSGMHWWCGVPPKIIITAAKISSMCCDIMWLETLISPYVSYQLVEECIQNAIQVLIWIHIFLKKYCPITCHSHLQHTHP